MKVLLVILGLCATYPLYSQGCFEKCRDHLSAPLQAGEDLQVRLEKSAQVLKRLVGCHIPEFNVTTIKGELLNSKDLRGKVVVMNFWFESCETCITSIPELNKIADEYSGKDVVFVAFSRDPENHINKFLVNHEFKYQIVSSQYDVSESMCVIGGWPMNMIIDKKGVVQYLKAGGLSKETSARSLADAMRSVIDKSL